MGFIKNAKQASLEKEAARAVEEGRTVFTPMLNTPWSNVGLSGSVSGWAEMVEGVESAGWVLTHWAVTQDGKGGPQAYPLFRRR